MIRRRLRKADSMDRSFLSDSYSARWAKEKQNYIIVVCQLFFRLLFAYSFAFFLPHPNLLQSNTKVPIQAHQKISIPIWMYFPCCALVNYQSLSAQSTSKGQRRLDKNILFDFEHIVNVSTHLLPATVETLYKHSVWFKKLFQMSPLTSSQLQRRLWDIQLDQLHRLRWHRDA